MIESDGGLWVITKSSDEICKNYCKNLTVKASLHRKIDAEERRLGKETGLDTPVPPTVNDEWWSLKILVVQLTL